MFNEDEEWSDEQDDQVLSKPVLKNIQKANSSTNAKAKLVGKKSLMRTLQTLGSVPEWKNEDHQQGSDSEAEEVPTNSKKKRKKKRSKRRKQAEITGEPQENGKKDQTANEEKSVPKNKKTFVTPKAKTTSVAKTKEKEVTQSATVNGNNPEDTEQLNRKQWKNKMKNKRKCNNKYRQNKDEEVNKGSAEPDKTKQEGKIHSNTKSKTPAKKKEKQRKPQKRKNTKEETDVSASTERLQTVGKVKKAANESSAGGSKHKADEPIVEITDDQHPSPIKRLRPELSKAEILKREKLRKMLHNQEKVQQEQVQQESPAEMKDEPVVPEEEVQQDRSASLRSRMEQRLESARFRYINEVLYSTSSGEARRMFKQDPEAFGIYHRGYTAQVQRWPANPVEAIISYIQQKPPSLVVADFGCGDCKIASSVKNKVHSFDLVATCELVTVCDMTNVPLPDRSVDIAVFCLSLMGTNLADFLAEANRVLKMGGVLKIAEVASRFENVRNFVTGLASLGFKMVSKDAENTYFHSFELLKTADAPENIKTFGLQLKPCVYKKR
ncbi:hypothetical protein PBY51_009831 [Eleginops maclovinus]|uniref:Ribosomal RNA-processing protein 8 n=1 Tax=Eleginops maclovinus TaxID=56733 RepID=A0AAN7XXS5_ELEMC|nr:hypothetical protein PBY51_009831 [Eleginops maclovinus]